MSNFAFDWYMLQQPELVASPALLVSPEVVRDNIRKLIGMAGSAEKLRPHVKTCKAAEPIKLMISEGIRQFKCATIAEAELLATCGASDILLAYPLTGPAISRFLRLRDEFPESDFSCLVDNSAGALSLNEAVRTGNPVPVWIDLNVGMNRTGILPSHARALYDEINAMQSLQFRGLHAYDGHIHQDWLGERQEALATAFAPVWELRATLEMLEGAPVKLVAGGTPSFPYHLQHNHVECSPGTFVYWDRGYEGFQEQPFQQAAVLLCRIVSLPAENRICVDLGHKAVAAENELSRRVTFLNAADLRPVSQSEEHLVLEINPGHGYQVGDVLYGVPYHICPTVALHESAVCVHEGIPAGEWLTVARKRKISI
ncbi:D-TA family PLP-dependent enzyme [Flavihumibacter petaseus]|uniref:Putative D-threonine aldolase n=1 Tax=Flavihumibacter petaseus NBRC 106054 TaxID=1220578 RepID=A0A0E9N715_9BACT|nr:D-TA family PLP-dependent enzyme [Flavihumibacter petaseus]GAO45619.1 putative D-threonine aldolase [Flavihumibacter petaseus NBRC 106054]